MGSTTPIMQLSIVIPAYNEEERLPLTLDNIIEYLTIHYRGDYEILIADDGSTDRTTEIVAAYMQRHPQLRLLKSARNRGRGAAVKDAIFETKGDYILETDADGSVNEHAITAFLSYLLTHPDIHVLTGSRTVAGSRILTPQPFLRMMLGYSFFVLAKLCFGWPVMDRINAFKMYRRAAALDIFRHQYENRFVAKAEVVLVAETRGWRVKELPILWTERSGSKVRPIRDASDSLLGLLRILRRKRQGLYTANVVVAHREEPPKQTKLEFKNALVTGGAGFIGSNFIRHYYQNHPTSRVVNLDLLTYAGNVQNLADLQAQDSRLPLDDQRYRFVQGDICDEALLERLFNEHHFDLVVHFAAESHVDRSIFNMSDFVRTNIVGTRTLVEAGRRHGVQRFINISTDELYGSIKDGYATEEWLLMPSNPYSASKAGADLLVQAYIRTHDFPAVIIRGSNNYGPYQYPEKLIPLAITNLLEGKKIPVHGYGIHVRSWLNVHDFCRAIDTIAHGQPKQMIYNVAGEEKTNHDVLELIARSLGKKFQDHRFHVNDRPGADHRYAVNGSRLEHEFGWQRIHEPFAKQIEGVVQWYIDNDDWWRAIRVKQGFVEHYERQSKGQWT